MENIEQKIIRLYEDGINYQIINNEKNKYEYAEENTIKNILLCLVGEEKIVRTIWRKRSSNKIKRIGLQYSNSENKDNWIVHSTKFGEQIL